MNTQTLRLILGDQLHYNHSWFGTSTPSITYVLMETKQEATYVCHHKQKVVAFFLAMRLFKKWLQESGHKVIYLTLDDSNNLQNFRDNITKIIKKNKFNRLEYLQPDEWRVTSELSELCNTLKKSTPTLQTECFESEHFLVSHKDISKYFGTKKSYVMEPFYREMRKNSNLLMDGSKPLGGTWNYDKVNRSKLSKKAPVPTRPAFDHASQEIENLLDKEQIKTIGSIKNHTINWPLNRTQALEALDFFLVECLPYFGTYQDAMHTEHRFLFHSCISFALNVKFITPLEVCQKAQNYWEEHSNKTQKDNVTIAQVEGFIRQIIGWREYMRGIYWSHMPGYATLNFFEHKAPLPSYYWTGKTKLRCVQHAVTQSLEEAYAHHIQRLMITGNFALLAGVEPAEVDDWYLGIYIDALEWVEITNTRGMSQFADGGIVGTKPYVSSANYINKMSNYCTDCHYNKDLKHGENACPFNSLYWEFFHRNRSKLQSNYRLKMVYNVLDKMSSTEKEAVFTQANQYRENLESL
jgi:deoxyribodipyrimidine photolyase-related protein